MWNYMLFFQWSGSVGYWLPHSPLGWWEPFLMNIGGCNNFILSTDAARLLIQLRSGCQWRLIASGCGKLIPEEMSSICFSNSGRKYWREDSEPCMKDKSPGTFTGSVQPPQVGAQSILFSGLTSQTPLSPSVSVGGLRLMDRRTYIWY